MEMSKEEKIDLFQTIKKRIDNSQGLSKKQSEFLYEEAVRAFGFISFRAIVSGVTPKAARNGYLELKFDTSIDGVLVHSMTDVFRRPVQVTIDPEDGQGKLAGEDGIPIDEQSGELFDEEEEIENN